MSGIINSFLNANQQSKNNQAFKQLQSTSPTSGVYLGRVTNTQDVMQSGLITVSISKLGKDDSTTSTEFYCAWSSPFAGTTDVGAVGNEVENFDQTQKSYGMWMVPPDVGNLVLVAFADNNIKMPFIIGCLFDNQYHYMVPGMAAGKSYGDPNMLAPVAEKNRKDSVVTHNNANRPIHVDMAETINRQGLINDFIRGAGASSSRRESPSKVFGILTPGPRDPNNKKNRIGGHQFIMDDHEKSRLIRLRTAGGSQLLLDDTTGSIYAINKLGTSWMEMTATGDFHVYAGSSINMRTRGNFNIRADKNVNIEAGKDVNIKAAGDQLAGEYVGLPDILAINLPSLGAGGDINLEAGSNMNSLARGNQVITSGGGSIDMSSAGATRIRTGVQADDPTLGFFVKAVGGIQMDTDLTMQYTSKVGAEFATGGNMEIFGLLTNINSAQGAALAAASATLATTRALVMTSATPRGTNSFEDNSTDPPEFDKDAARKGEVAFPTGGLREKTPLPIQSIVSTLVTNEPFVGHAQYDPTENASTVPNIGEAPLSLPPNATDLGGAPADVSLPPQASEKLGAAAGEAAGLINSAADAAGTFLAGIGFTSKDGDTVSTGGVLGGLVGEATNQLNKLGGNFGELSAQYQQINGVINNFQTLQDVNLLSIQGLTAAINAIQSIIPFIPFPTTSPLQQKIIGYQKQLNEQMAELEQFATDQFGQIQDLLDGAIGEMRGQIENAFNQALDGAEFDKLLADAGIENIGKGLIPPEDIYKDKLGNILVDFGSKGLGQVGASLGLTADINSAFNNVKGYFNKNVQLTENQTTAISNFIHSVGEETFLNSNVFQAINEGKLDRVPQLMQGWVLGTNQPGDPSQPLPYLQDRRVWEAEIFQTPDGTPIPDFSEMGVGELTYRSAASMYRAARREYLRGLVNSAENQGLDI